MERIGVAPGTEIGGYRVLAPLGQGGMGAVYRAVDGDGTVVALKLLHPHLGADPDARERLRREVANLQRVRHRGVARVLDAEIDSSDAFIVTELVDGPDLATLVRTDGPLAGQRLTDLADQLRDALEAVHAAGVLHRDLTPGNVLVTDDGPVLIDFGIAQAAEDARVTSTGLVAGTPGYLSPQMLEGAEPTEATDWWGWAALLAFAATGRPPFGVRPLAAVLARARTGDADLVGLGTRTAAALRSALVVDPTARSTPETVVAALREATDRPDDVDQDAVVTAVGALAGAGTPGPPPPPDATAVTVVADPADAVATTVVASDGRTRVMPVDAQGRQVGSPPPPAAVRLPDPAPSSYPPAPVTAASAEPWADPAPLDEAEVEEDDGEDEPEAPDGPEEPKRRLGTVLAIGTLLVAVGAVRPGVALSIGVVLAVLARSVGYDVAAMQSRRERRGIGRADTARAVLTWPWYLVRGVIGVVPAVLVAASAIVVVGGVGWWLVDSGRLVVAAPPEGEAPGALAGNAAWVAVALLAAAVLIGLLIVWFGPMSRTTRTGARWALAAVAPGPLGAVVVTLLALAAAAFLITLALAGQDVVWWPLPGPPELRAGS